MNKPIKVWDLPVRVFHWTLAISFAVAYTIAETDSLRGIHVMLGYTVLGLVAFRVLWGFIGTRYARFSSFAYGPGRALVYLRELVAKEKPHYTGHNPAGSWAVYLLLTLAFVTGVSGYLTLNEVGGEAFEEVHEVAANAWLVVVIGHIAGVIASSLAQRENLARAMVTGYKRGEQSLESPSFAKGAGILVAIAVAGFWTWSLLTGTAGATVNEGAAGAQEVEHAEGRDVD